MTGCVTIHRTYFLEREVWEGGFPRDDTRTDVHDELTAREAADLIKREGLSFEASGWQWAADPDGTHIVDYGSGQRVEVSAHLSEFPDRVADAIMTAVG